MKTEVRVGEGRVVEKTGVVVAACNAVRERKMIKESEQ